MHWRAFVFCLALVLVLSSSRSVGNGDPSGNEMLIGADLGEGSYIHLRYSVFDPLVGEPSIDPALTEEGDVMLVQLKGPARTEWADRLEEKGRILGFLQEHTYVVRTDYPRAFSSMPFVRWAGPFHPAYRIDGRLLSGSDEERVSIDVVLFRDAPMALSMESIEGLGARSPTGFPGSGVISAEADREGIIRIAGSNLVQWVSPSEEMHVAMDNIRVYTGASIIQNTTYNGSGVVGEVKDAGIHQDHPEFEGQIVGTDGDPGEHNHGTGTFGIVYAKGVSPRAKGMNGDGGGVFCDWGVGRYESMQNLVENWDGVFQTNSWYQGNTDGTYSQFSAEDDLAVIDWDATMLYASGNGGDDGTCTQDSVAKNVIAVGGIRHINNRDWEDDYHNGNQGNKGPAADGRIKPDLCGPYESIHTTSGSSGYTEGFGGTSGATPVAAGGIGLIYDIYEKNGFSNNPLGEHPHASTVKALAIANAHQYNLSAADRYAQGWGHIDAGSVINNSASTFIVNEGENLITGESIEFRIDATGGSPLKISLVWTDAPGLPSSNRALVNDLDLVVSSPSGTVYRGNAGLVDNLWSTSGGARDDLNNVENVFIENPAQGRWTIEITGTDVPVDADDATTERDQPFSVVAIGVEEVEHDVGIMDVELPRYLEPDVPVAVGVSVVNLGQNNESNLTVRFLVNGKREASTRIIDLPMGGMSNTTLNWTPVEKGWFDLSVNVAPVNGEERIFNNWHNRTMRVFKPRARVVLDLNHGLDSHRQFIRDMEADRFHVHRTDQPVDDGTFDNRTAYMVFNPQTGYSADELSEIRSFVKRGGGLFVVGDDDAGILGDLTLFAGINWTNVHGVDGVTDNVEEHNVTHGVDTMYFNSTTLTLGVSGQAKAVVTDEAPVTERPLIVVSTAQRGRVVAVSDHECLNDQYYGEEQNDVLAINSARWMLDLPPHVDILEPTGLEVLSPDGLIAFWADGVDPDGDDLDYRWESDIDGEFGSESAFNSTLSPGGHVITVTVSDGFSSDSDSVKVSVNSTPELSLIGPDDSHFAYDSIEFKWNSSDLEGDPLNHTLRIWNGDVIHVYRNLINVSFELDNLTIGESYSWNVSVSDPYWTERSETRTFRFGNRAPLVYIISPMPDERVSSDAVLEWGGSDDDEDPMVFTLYMGSDDMNEIVEGNVTSHDPGPLDQGSTYHWYVTADDGYNVSTTEIVNFTVNSLPQTVSRGPGPGARLSAHFAELNVSSFDPDGDEVDVRIYIGDPGELMAEGGGTAIFTMDDPDPGHYVWYAELDDGNDTVVLDTWGFDINEPPTIELKSPRKGKTADRPTTLEWEGGDEEGDELLYTVLMESGEGFETLTSTRDEEFMVNLTPGSYRWRVVVSDGVDSATSPVWRFDVPSLDPEAEIIDISPSDSYLGDNVTFRGYAGDPDGDLDHVEWRTDRSGLLSRKLVFTINNLTAGTHTITFTAIDDFGNVASDTAIITVEEPPDLDAPTAVLDIDYPDLRPGTTITFDLSDSYDRDGDVVLYHIDFGDGSGSGWVDDPIITHEYLREGRFMVRALVMDDDDLESKAVVEGVRIAQEEDSSDEESESVLDQLTQSNIGLVLLIVIVIVVVALASIRRPARPEEFQEVVVAEVLPVQDAFQPVAGVAPETYVYDAVIVEPWEPGQP